MSPFEYVINREFPQMDAALSVILPPFGFLCKAKPLLLQIGGSSLRAWPILRKNH